MLEMDVSKLWIQCTLIGDNYGGLKSVDRAFFVVFKSPLYLFFDMRDQWFRRIVLAEILLRLHVLVARHC